MAKMRNRVATLLAATTMMVGVSLSVGAGTASAAFNVTYTVSHYDGNKSATIYLYLNGDYAGYVNWNADPDSFGTPGDALRAYDGAADGNGIRGVTRWPSTNGTERTVSTYGHAYPYYTGWNTGNLAEGTSLDLYGCLGKSAGPEACTGPIDIRA
ncbi:hypothetical protein [Streptomyces sp. NPDC050704]|uniref:hypothetical protein n=1 Tax=Streptomyces sp. NPDC050704 TaxID=3157219 RepID=UPI0034209003